MIVEADLKGMSNEDLVVQFEEKLRLVHRKKHHWESSNASILKQEILRRMAACGVEKTAEQRQVLAGAENVFRSLSPEDQTEVRRKAEGQM